MMIRKKTMNQSDISEEKIWRMLILVNQSKVEMIRKKTPPTRNVIDQLGSGRKMQTIKAMVAKIFNRGSRR